MAKGLMCLEESLEILKHEPEHTFEGKIYTGAVQSLEPIRKFFERMCQQWILFGKSSTDWLSSVASDLSTSTFDFLFWHLN